MAKSFPDLNDDGEVDRKDVLRGRGVPGFKKGGDAKWIQSAIKKPGALRKSLGIKAGEKIPAKKLAKATKAPGKLGQRARLAQTLKKMK
jgi:protein involved in temperature-dependent protein secretion